MKNLIIVCSCITFAILTSCSQKCEPGCCTDKQEAACCSKDGKDVDDQAEKEAIIQTLRLETEHAFAREYDEWAKYWVHSPDISKIYLNYADNTFSETIGWERVSGFVADYFKEHPERVPPPAQPESMDIRLYGDGAWVSYQIMDAVFGEKRETRLMEKEDGLWKIAGMQTTIYGFDDNNLKEK